MEAVIDVKPETQAIIKQSESLAAQLQSFKITNQDEYTTAGEYLKSVKSATKQLEELRVSMTKPLDESKKRIMDFFRKPLDILAQAESTLKKGVLTYQQEQERKRREEEARLAEIQRKEAEKLAKKAEKAEAKGNTEKAEELRQQAQETQMITPTVANKVEKVAGISTKKIWRFKIVDTNKIPRQYLIPNEKMLGQVAQATKGTLKIEGVEFYADEIISAGR